MHGAAGAAPPGFGTCHDFVRLPVGAVPAGGHVWRDSLRWRLQLPRERPVQDTRQAVIPVSQEYGSKREVLDWHTSLRQIATRTNDAIPASVIVKVVLGYKQADNAASTEITQCQTEIKDYLRRYFTALTVEDLRPRNEEERRSEIRNAINDHILSSSEIRDVRFLSLQVIEW